MMTLDSSFLALVADHLWQSTLFTAVVAALTLVFRRHHAHVRYWLWLTASIKFALPFAALMALGSSFGWTAAPLPQPALRLAVQTAAQPFSPTVTASTPNMPIAPDSEPWRDPSVQSWFRGGALLAWALGSVALLIRWSARWQQLRQIVRRARPLVAGREIEILRRVERNAARQSAVPLLLVDSVLEPGIVGVIRPVLLWPASISDRFDDEQMTAVFEHELAHVRRADNLTATLHMAIEAVFWFHPLVWWLSARLIDERERACDESVLGRGGNPERYAETLLRTCEFYLQAPLSCMTGVTGADLRKRIETIMRNRTASAVRPLHAALLSAFAVGTIVAPITIGVLGGPRLLAAQAPTGSGARFETVSIKRNTSGVQGGTMQNPPGRYVATNISLRMLIRNAYGVLDSQIASGPKLATADYFSAEKFDVIATFTGEATREARGEMMRNLLADRFKLVTHTEMRELPVYALVRVRPDTLGPNLKPAEDAQCTSARADAERDAARGVGPGMLGVVGGRGRGPNCGALQFGPGQYVARSVPIDQLVSSLSNQPALTAIDRIVLDRTGLTDRYDFDLRWRAPAPPAGAALPPGVTPPAPDPDRPDLFTALQEQLGLKLETQRAPIEVVVIDSVEMPSEN